MELIVCVCILSAAIVFAAYTQQPKREAVTVPPVDKVLEVAQGVIMQQAELIDRFGDRLMGFTAEGREAFRLQQELETVKMQLTDARAKFHATQKPPMVVPTVPDVETPQKWPGEPEEL